MLVQKIKLKGGKFLIRLLSNQINQMSTGCTFLIKKVILFQLIKILSPLLRVRRYQVYLYPHSVKIVVDKKIMRGM